MTIHAAEAISTLESLVSSLLSGASPAGILVTPNRVSPAGLGAFVGLNRDPAGTINATRVDASVFVTVEGNSVNALNNAVTSVTNAVLGVPRANLIEDGILKATLVEVAPRTSGQGAPMRQDVTFNILYEFVKLPDAAEGIIEEIPISLRNLDPEAIVDAEFMTGSLDWFEVVDDPLATAGAPSDWRYNADERRIEQRSRIRGGQNVANANKPGTYLVLRTASDPPPVRDFALETTLRSEDGQGAIGLVFRYRDVDNFYFLLMDPSGYRMMARKVAGSFSQLTLPALDTSNGYAPGVDHDVRLEAEASTFRVVLDGAPILEGGDTTFPAAGRVGFMSRRNDAAFFFRIKLVEL